MSSSEENNKKKKHPFDYLDDGYLDQLFEKMQEFIDSDSFRNLVEDIIEDLSYNDAIMDHSIDIFDDEITYNSIEHIDNINDSFDKSFCLQKPVADIMKNENQVMITLYLPTVKREDIRLYCTESDFEIIIQREGRQLYDIFDLPALVDPTTASSSFHNGVLDIIIKRMNRGYNGVQVTVQ